MAATTASVRFLPSSTTASYHLRFVFAMMNGDVVGCDHCGRSAMDHLVIGENARSVTETLWTYVAPLLAVTVGWGLHELSDAIRLRREDRRAIGRILAEVLELRHSIRAIPVVVGEIRNRIAIPIDAEPVLRNIFSSVLSQMTAGIAERYNNAIDSISGRLPLLAYELRSKDQFHPVLNHLQALAGNDPGAVVAISAIEKQLLQELLPRLQRLALRLAWLHSWKTWLHLRSSLKKPENVSALVDSMLKSAGIASPAPADPS